MNPIFAPSSLTTMSWQQRECLLLAPYAMFGARSAGREFSEEQHPYRSPYQRDRDRVLHSAAFRRLSGKMQVFTGDMGDYHRTRLTHTNEVSTLARTIGRALQLNEDLIEAMALLHDIGHPPFGHCGEDALDECTHAVGGFSHNRFALDLVTKVEQRYTDYPGLNLTAEVMAGQQFRSDKETGRAPMLEMQVVDAADSMAYDAHDLDDALKLGLLTWDQLSGLAIIERAGRDHRFGQASPSNRRQLLVHAMLDVQMSDFLSNAMETLSEYRELDALAVQELGVRLEMTPAFEADKEELEEFLFDRVYRHPRLIEIRSKAAGRIHRLFEFLRQRPDHLPTRFQNWIHPWGLERTVATYIAGMTDRFCDEMYIKLVEQNSSIGEDWS